MLPSDDRECLEARQVRYSEAIEDGIQLDGQPIPQTEVTEHYLGRTWQRWSRHFRAGQWLSGVDSLESFLALVSRELARS